MMKPENYAYSPNNVHGKPGREIYPSSAGIPTLPNTFIIYDVGNYIDVYSTIYNEPLKLAHVLRFNSCADFIGHCEAIGYKSPEALPAFYNSDI